jgi:hypothetical protein
MQIFGYVRVNSQMTLSRMFLNYDGTLSQITCSISVQTLNYFGLSLELHTSPYIFDLR